MFINKSVKMHKVIIVLILVTVELVLAQNWDVVDNPLAYFKPCEDNENVTLLFEKFLKFIPTEEENQYLLRVNGHFEPNFTVDLIFDSDATVTLIDDSSATITMYPEERKFRLNFFEPSENLEIKVQGRPLRGIPYVQSIVVNTVEYCKEPKTGFLNNFVQTEELVPLIINPTIPVPDESCGRRKVQHTELIVNGLPTKPGDWPWHAAIYRLERISIDYICGGTLLSKIFVLTAAHCVTSSGGTAVLPETRNVILGKYNLVGGDFVSPQEKEIYKIIVHEGFKHDRLDNDIALLKLNSEVLYTDYVQPACVWFSDAYEKLPPGTIHGSVVGWGFNQKDKPSPKLQQVTIPMHTETTCIKSNPLFFSRLLNDEKFCAGFNNGTSACNGDSGGGFLVFVPDESGNTAPNAPGAWYIRGIVSLSVSRADAPICDPYHYVIFTDVAKFKGWLDKHNI